MKNKTKTWICVADRLPSKSGQYLVCRVGSDYYAVLDYSAKHKMFNAFDEVDAEHVAKYAIQVTHWKPLPKMPG